MATRNIKGITVEFDANTDKLKLGLRDINKEIKEVDQELKKVDQALKLDPGNAEQVARKMELLAEKSELAQNKVDALKEVQKTLEAEGVDKSSKSYQQLTTEIAKSEAEVRKLSVEMQAAERSFNEVTQGSKELSNYLNATGQTADDLVSILGAKLVDAYKDGSLGAAGYQKALQLLNQETTGSKSTLEEFRQILASVDDKADFSKVGQQLKELGDKAGLSKSELQELEQAETRLNTVFEATGKNARDFADILGSELARKIDSGEASGRELAQALDKIGAAAVGAKGDVGKFKSALDSVNTSGDYSRLSSDFREVGHAADEADDNIANFGEQLEALNKKVEDSNLMDLTDALEPVSDAMKEVGGAALEASGTVTDSFNTVKISLGETDEEAERTTEHIENVFANNFGGSMEDARDAVILVKQALGDLATEDNIEDLTEKVLTLADVCDVDAQEAIRGVKSMTEAWGISAEEAYDVAYWGIQNNLNISDEWLDNIAEYAPLFKDSGYSAQEMGEMVAAGMDAGAYSTDKVMDLVKEFGNRMRGGDVKGAVDELGGSFQALYDTMVESGASNKEIFQALGKEIQNLGSEEEKATAIQKIFGTQGEDAGIKVVEAMANATLGVEDFSGAADEAVAANSNASEQLGRSWEAVKLKLAPLGERIAEIANKILDILIPAIDWLSDMFDKIPDPIKDFIVAFGGISVVIMTLIPIIAGLIGAFSTISAALTAVGVAVGPFVAIVAGIVAAIAAAIAIFTHWDETCAAFSMIWSTFSEGIRNIWDGVCTFISNAWNNLWTGLGDFFAGIVDGLIGSLENLGTRLGEGVEAIKEAIAEKWKAMCDGLSEWWNSACEAVGNIFQGLKDKITNIAQGIKDFISGVWDNIKSAASDKWEQIKSTVQEKWESLKSKASDTFNNIKDNCSKIWEEIKSASGEKWESIKSAVVEKWEAMKSKAGDLFSNMKETISSIWEDIKSRSGEKWEDIKSKVLQVLEDMKSDARDKANSISDFVKSAWDDLRNNSQSTWDNITSNIKSKWEDLKSSASNQFNNIRDSISQSWNSIRDTASNIWDGVKNIVSNAVEYLKNLMNFRWELPQIKLPHFHISGSFSLVPPSVPSLSVDWYAKGGILTAPTIFGANGSTLLGGGEAGAEAVVPLSQMYSNLEEMFDDKVSQGNKEVVQVLEKVLQVQELMLAAFENQDTQIVLDGGALVGKLTPAINKSLGKEYNRGIRQ